MQPADSESGIDVSSRLSPLLDHILGRAADLYRNTEAQSRTSAMARVVARAALRSAPIAPAVRSVAVVGPTQVGKSTVVNLLLGSELAGVSPLAGFTTRPEGYLIDAEPTDIPLFVAADPPPALRAAPRPPGWVADRPVLLWDTPDFDTLAAGAYRESLLSVVAGCGVFVVVLSPEKYADLSVWQLLHLLGLLRRPILFVLNKLPPADADAIVAAFRAHVRRQMPELEPAAERVWRLPLGSAARLAGQAGDPQVASTVQQLRQRLIETPALDPPRVQRDAARLIRVFWDEWTAPIRAEQRAVARYCAQIDEVAARFERRYRASFLDDPQRYDTLYRVTAELLTLLDIPYLARWLGQVRFVAGLPGRWLLARLRSLLRRRRPSPHQAAGNESLILGELVDRSLVELTRFCLRQTERGSARPFWQAVLQRLEQQEPQLRRELEDRIHQHDDAFLHEIRAAAEELYARIRENPALLNSLRAGRVGADLAGVVVALKTAGTGLGEALLTPLMFSLTQSLTEGALGAYMARVAARLKKRQLEHVRQNFIEGVLRPKLAALARDLDAPDVWNIRQEDLAAAEAEIRRLEASG